MNNWDPKATFSKMSPGRKIFTWVFMVCMGAMCLRVAVGDLYYISDHRTFVCNAFPCFQRGYVVPYTGKDGREVTRYYCPEHRPPETAYVSSRDLIFEKPNIVATVLFVGFPCYLIYLLRKKSVRAPAQQTRPKG